MVVVVTVVVVRVVLLVVVVVVVVVGAPFPRDNCCKTNCLFFTDAGDGADDGAGDGAGGGVDELVTTSTTWFGLGKVGVRGMVDPLDVVKAGVVLEGRGLGI